MKPSTRERWQQLAALQGLISEATGQKLSSLASEVPADQSIVEIGSYKGKSTCYLAEGARLGNGPVVIAVDPWDLPGNVDGKHHYHGAFKDWERQVNSMGFTPEAVRYIKMFSTQAAISYREWPDDPKIGLLYIDGDHNYESVRDDFNAWSVHLAHHATLAFDDYNTRRNPGVKQFVDELFAPAAVDLSVPPLAVVKL